MKTEYAELHCHSAFSLLDGASLPETLVERAIELELSALALTDHDDLGGAVRFASKAREHNQYPAIIGAEVTLLEQGHISTSPCSREPLRDILTSARSSGRHAYAPIVANPTS